MEGQPIYKTAAELGIPQWEHDGLVALIGPLSRGELAFDMMQPHQLGCGSACCIGGWVRANAGVPYASLPQEGLVAELYFAYESDIALWLVEQHHAARAIINFLITGNPQWDAVMADAA